MLSIEIVSIPVYTCICVVSIRKLINKSTLYSKSVYSSAKHYVYINQPIAIQRLDIKLIFLSAESNLMFWAAFWKRIEDEYGEMLDMN